MRLGLTFVYSNNAFCLEKETDLVVSEDAHAGIKSQAAEPWTVWSHHESPLPPLPKTATASPKGLREAITLLTAWRKLLAALVTLVLALWLYPPSNWCSCLRAVNQRDAVLSANKKTMKKQMKRTGWIPMWQPEPGARFQMSDINHVSNWRIFRVKGLPTHEREECENGVKQSQAAKRQPLICSKLEYLGFSPTRSFT